MVEISKILVPVDGSSNSHRALEYARYLAERCGASLDLLNVIKLTSAVGLFSDPGTGVYIPEGVIEGIQEAGRKVVDEALALVPSGITAQGFVEDGAPAEAIVAFATEHEHDLIVVGSRGLGAIQQMVFGSVSSYVLHRAQCPVMVIR